MKTTLLTFLSFICLSFSINAQIAFTKNVISSTTGTGPYVIDSGQLSNDLIGGEYYNDIVIGTDGGNTVEYYKNLGGSFDTGTTLIYAVGAELTNVNGVHIADLNDDNLNDIIATGYSNNRLVWFENKGDGTFEDSVLITTTSGLIGAGTVTSANLDNDANGYVDLAVVVYDNGGNTDSVIYLIGDGLGGFTSEGFIVPETAGLGPTDVDLADFDNDGDIDAVVSFGDTGDVFIYDNDLIPGGTVGFNVYDNVVDGANGYVFSVTFGDVNNDMQLDVIVADLFPGANPRVAWWEPTFSPVTPTDPTDTTFSEHVVVTGSSQPARALVANINNDVNNYNDIVISNGPTGGANDITWARGNGMAPPNEFDTEEAVEVSGSTQGAYSITINDFNNDNILDIATISYLTTSVSWYLNDGNTLSVVDDLITDNISIYPNPTTNILNFNGTFTSDLIVSVYDVLGKRVINSNVKFGQPLNVSKLNNGVYIIKFEGYDNTYKFVKK